MPGRTTCDGLKWRREYLRLWSSEGEAPGTILTSVGEAQRQVALVALRVAATAEMVQEALRTLAQVDLVRPHAAACRASRTAATLSVEEAIINRTICRSTTRLPAARPFLRRHPHQATVERR